MVHRYCKNAIFSLFVGDLLCYKLTVTGDDYASVTGTYIISNEKASTSQDKPVYKLEGKDRYIYYHPGGWRIGSKYNAAGAFFSSKIFIPFFIQMLHD
jgi:hypothetical protein